MLHKPLLGIIGAGRLGTAVARRALEAGYHVRIANSRDPETLELILSVLLPGAVASTVHDTILKADIVLLALPLGHYKMLPSELFTGKIVIDAMNYWPPTEGVIAEFANDADTTSEVVARYFQDAFVVKSFSHIAYNELNEQALPEGSPNRRALALAGNDPASKAQVFELINDLGFDAVDVGDLRYGRWFQPDTALFNTRVTAKEMRTALRSATP
jgi:predicted dinucleotide-binding enzyme